MDIEPEGASTHPVRRGGLLIISTTATVLAALIYLVAWPALLRTSWQYAVLFAELGVMQIVTALVLLVRPTLGRAWAAAGSALLVLVIWALVRFTDLLPNPDPWVPVNSVIGFTDWLGAALQAIGVVGIGFAVRKPHGSRSTLRKIIGGVALTPLLLVVLLLGAIGIAAAGDGFTGAGFPRGAVAPRNLPAGQRSTVEYCHADEVPLAMDVYPPTVHNGRSPVVLYSHGGGFIFGDRKMTGLGAKLANHDGALFPAVQRKMSEQGITVVSIDYRLAPATRWPKQLEDTKCALRFLRAHAADLNIDTDRIATWGSSAGALMATLTGLDTENQIRAVVDMFSPADLTDIGDASALFKLSVKLELGDSPDNHRDASPINHITPGAPAFLVLQGDQDPSVRPRQSVLLTDRLRAAGVPVTLIEVHGTGHTVDTPGQQPPADELAARVATFLSTALRA